MNNGLISENIQEHQDKTKGLEAHLCEGSTLHHALSSALSPEPQSFLSQSDFKDGEILK